MRRIPFCPKCGDMAGSMIQTYVNYGDASGAQYQKLVWTCVKELCENYSTQIEPEWMEFRGLA